MKNIHVIPTDKPSRLFYNVGGTLLFTNYKHYNGVNIYITSDEEIKEGDWCLDIKRNIIFQSKRSEIGTSKKIPIIICTYEGCYIQKDCKKIILTTNQLLDGVQAIDDEFLEWFVKNPSCDEVDIADLWKEGTPSAHDSYQIIIPKEEPQKIELNSEVAEYLGFVKGVEWQMERSHSDKEVLELLVKMNEWPTTFDGEEDIKEWFEQFKNKLYNITK